MDPLAIGIIAVVIAGVAWIVFKSDDDDTPAPTPAPTPTPNPVPGKLRSGKPSGKIIADKVADKASEKLPTKKSMEAMTKANLEELGRRHGVELDKRKTKANMIADLKAGVKK